MLGVRCNDDASDREQSRPNEIDLAEGGYREGSRSTLQVRSRTPQRPVLCLLCDATERWTGALDANAGKDRTDEMGDAPRGGGVVT